MVDLVVQDILITTYKSITCNYILNEVSPYFNVNVFEKYQGLPYNS